MVRHADMDMTVTREDVSTQIFQKQEAEHAMQGH